jgi:diguanylate cyclase (GGDEF)-like protein
MMQIGALPAAARDDLALGDWQALFDAVRSRLRHIAGQWLVAACELRAHGQALRSQQAGVRECMAALDGLQLALMHELERGRRAEAERRAAHDGLARMQAALLNAQAGAQRAWHMALLHGLPTLPDSRFFCERLDLALAHAGPRRPLLVLLHVDPGPLGGLADRRGAAIGNEVLRIVAARMAREMRAQDLLGRLGEGFGCLLFDMPSREPLVRLARKLLEAVAAPLRIGEVALTLRPGIGIAVCPADGCGAEALLEAADAALARGQRQPAGYAFAEPPVPERAHA